MVQTETMSKQLLQNVGKLSVSSVGQAKGQRQRSFSKSKQGGRNRSSSGRCSQSQNQSHMANVERDILHASALPMDRTADAVVPKDTMQNDASPRIQGIQETQRDASLIKTHGRSHQKDLMASNLKKMLSRLCLAKTVSMTTSMDNLQILCSMK